MIDRVRNFLRRFRRHEKGVSAVEFALIAPAMIALYLGAVEISLALQIDRKATSAASAIADLVAQDDVVTDAEITSIMTAGEAIIAPFDTGPLQIRITSIYQDSDDNVEVQWSDARGLAPHSPGGSISVPAGILDTNRAVIMVEVAYTYRTMFEELGVSQFDIEEVFYLRPRRSIVVARS